MTASAVGDVGGATSCQSDAMSASERAASEVLQGKFVDFNTS